VWVCVDCARALLAVHNVEIDVQNKLGDTPLHNAAWKGHAVVVSLLLEKGINDSIRDQLEYSEIGTCKHVLCFLLENNTVIIVKKL